MKLAIVWHTTYYRGDHSAEVDIGVEPKPGETVEDLVKRVNVISGADWISIKKIWIEAEPKVV
jgi:hypothetical protein